MRYRLLVESVSDYAIFMLDTTGHVISWNKGAQRIKGYTASEIIGKHFSTFYSEPDLARDYPASELKWAVQNGRFEDEGWRKRKDGSLFWANVIITAVLDKDKKLLGFSKVTRDLTERKKLEEQLKKANEELRESEERARLLIDSVHDYAIFMLDPNGRIITWNAGAEGISGYTAQEIIGRHFSCFYTQKAVESGFPQYELTQAVKNGRFEDEGLRIKKDGSSSWMNVVISPIYKADGILLGFSKVIRDLSERRKNEELMLKNRQLMRINNDLDNFVYTASHDLKAPIANLEGLIHILEEEELRDNSTAYQEVLSKVNSSINRLKDVISDLTDIAKVQQDDNLVLEWVEVSEVLEKVIQTLDVAVQASKAVLDVSIPKYLFLRYSRKNLHSIFLNLISNAIKYAAPDRPPVLAIKIEPLSADKLLLTVKDNGLGIDASQQEKVFYMFKRLYTHVEGTGIGLYIVKRILENADDSIEVESEIGHGSTFKVYFNQKHKFMTPTQQELTPQS